MVIHSTIKYLFLFSLTILFACSKEPDNNISEIPFIEFRSLEPTIISQSEGPIIFSVFYTDGDGDLGENTPDVKNLFLKDLRNNIEYEYRLQQLAPGQSSIAIQGIFEVELNSTFITDESNEQQVSYEIRVIDRAGNQSNTITTDPLTVTN